MLERRLVGRRYTDMHLDASIPPYPLELERRRKRRRLTDRDEGLESFDTLRFKRIQRLSVFYTAVWSCRQCGREGKRLTNLPKEGRQYVAADFATGSISLSPCTCGHSDWDLDWILQAGPE